MRNALSFLFHVVGLLRVGTETGHDEKHVHFPYHVLRHIGMSEVEKPGLRNGCAALHDGQAALYMDVRTRQVCMLAFRSQDAVQLLLYVSSLESVISLPWKERRPGTVLLERRQLSQGETRQR